MLYFNKRSPSEELASVHNPNSPTSTSTWHHSLGHDQKMTEVVAYPQPQHLYHFGGSSHRLLAPAPEQKKSPYFSPDLYREMPVYPVGYQTTSHLPRSPPEARSASVSSISSAASHGTPNMSSSRTMSPVTDSNSSDFMASPPALTRTYNPPSSYHHTHHTKHTSQVLPSSLIPAPSHYLHAQVAPPPPMSLYPSMPAPLQRTTTYPPSSSYGYHQHMGHSYPSQQPMHNYHQLSMQSYHQPMYTYTSSQTYPSLPAFAPTLGSTLGASVMSLAHTQQRHQKSALERALHDHAEIALMIQSHLDYFDVCRAQMASRWFRDNFKPELCPEEDKIRCVMYAEINFKRFWPNNTSSGGRGGDKDDGKHPGFFGCYHCFKVKAPENFELFRWKNDLEDAPDSNSNNTNNDQKSQRGSVSSAASSKQQPPSPSTSSHTSSSSFSALTSNPHYDPSVTRSSLAAAAASSRGQNVGARRGGNGATHSSSGTYSSSDQSPRIQETWGIRRFCIDCGIKKKFYRPGVLIELHKEKNAVWVCDCWVTHKRPQELDCKVCKKILPLSTPNRRRG